MNCVQCPECGASEVPAQSNSCPDCGYPIVTLSGFNIRERLREAAPQQAEATQSPLTAPGVSKGKKLKAKLSRAKDALAKKAKAKKSLEEIVLPQIKQLPTDGNESSSNDLSLSQQLKPDLPVAPHVQAIIQPEATVDRITLAAPDEQTAQILEEAKTTPQPDVIEPEAQEQAIFQPDVTVDRITLVAPDEQTPQILEEAKTMPEPDVIEPEAQVQAIIQPDATVDKITLPAPDEQTPQILEEAKTMPEPDVIESQPALPAQPEPLEQAIFQPETTVDKITLQAPDEQPPHTLDEAKAMPEPDVIELQPALPAEPDLQEQAIFQPEATEDRITLAAPNEPTPQILEEAKTTPEPDVIEPEPVAISEREEKSKPILSNPIRYKPSEFAGFQLSTRDTSPTTEAFQCYECGTEVDANANFCPYCHASLLRRLCPACRRLVAGNTSFCAFCGTPASALAEPPRNFSTIFAVLIIVFTAVVIYFAKDFIFEDPSLDRNLAKVRPEESTPSVPEPTVTAPSKPVDSSNSAKNISDQQPGVTTEARPNKNGLIETTIREDGSVQQDSIQPLPSQELEKGELQERSTLKPMPVVVTPNKNTQRATTPPPAGFNRGQIAGIPSYKHRDAGLARYLNSVGFRLIRQRRYEEAVPLLKRSVSYFPENTKDIVYAYALFNLGHALRMSGRANEAIPVLEARMKIDNQRETVRRELAAAKVAALRAPLR